MDRPVCSSPASRVSRGEKGQGMTEYGLIIMLVALVVFAALMILGPIVANLYNNTGNSLAQ